MKIAYDTGGTQSTTLPPLEKMENAIIYKYNLCTRKTKII
jgi:hypothetical protein